MCSRNPLHALIFVGVGAFLLSRGVGWGWILIGIGLMKFAGWLRTPGRSLAGAIRNDAARFGLRVPRDPVVTQRLERLYARLVRSKAAFPQMAPDYQAIVNATWEELALATTLREWRDTLGRALAHWPKPEAGPSPLDESLRQAKRAAARWREARHEAWRA